MATLINGNYYTNSDGGSRVHAPAPAPDGALAEATSSLPPWNMELLSQHRRGYTHAKVVLTTGPDLFIVRGAANRQHSRPVPLRTAATPWCRSFFFYTEGWRLATQHIGRLRGQKFLQPGIETGRVSSGETALDLTAGTGR